MRTVFGDRGSVSKRVHGRRFRLKVVYWASKQLTDSDEALDGRVWVCKMGKVWNNWMRDGMALGSSGKSRIALVRNLVRELLGEIHV